MIKDLQPLTEGPHETFNSSVKSANYYEHLQRYAFASELCRNNICLDLSSDDGSGANLLARNAKQDGSLRPGNGLITDYQNKCDKENVPFLTGTATEIPLDDSSVDVITAFGTIDCVVYHHRFLQELLRILRPEELIIISSATKVSSNATETPGLSYAEFGRLLAGYFSKVILGKQRGSVGSVSLPYTAPIDESRFGFFTGDVSGTRFSEGVSSGAYFIAVCCNKALPTLNFGFFEDSPYLAESTAVA